MFQAGKNIFKFIDANNRLSNFAPVFPLISIQLTFSCSKSTIERIEKDAKYVQS